MEYASTSNSNNRKLQERLDVFQNKKAQFKNKKILSNTRTLREFEASPEATKAYISKVKEEARLKRIKDIAYYTVFISVIMMVILYFFGYVLPRFDF